MAVLDVKVLMGGGGGSLPDLKLATIDVAVGGMRCASNVPLDPGDCLRMKLELVGGDLHHPATIVGDARVLRCSERPEQAEVLRYEIALAFTQMSQKDRKRLESYLNCL